jgi:hypothetical protein
MTKELPSAVEIAKTKTISAVETLTMVNSLATLPK